MSKGIIFYCSSHHGNTEKLVKGISEMNSDIKVVALLSSEKLPDLAEYEFVGLASGIYMAKPHEQLMKFIQDNKDVLKNKKLLTILTSGSNQASYGKDFLIFLKEQGLQVSQSYQCKGWDTYGLWKHIGGISKKHPNQADIEKLNNVIQM